jgi:hypothetical protein
VRWLGLLTACMHACLRDNVSKNSSVDFAVTLCGHAASFRNFLQTMSTSFFTDCHAWKNESDSCAPTPYPRPHHGQERTYRMVRRNNSKCVFVIFLGPRNCKMEEDVKPEDEDGVDGRGVCGWDGLVCGFGASLAFELVRGTGAFAEVLPSFDLVSRMPFVQRYRGNATSFSAASSSGREAMVGGALARALAFRVGLGVSGATIVSGSCACPSHLWISRVLTSPSSLGISSLKKN